MTIFSKLYFGVSALCLILGMSYSINALAASNEPASCTTETKTECADEKNHHQAGANHHGGKSEKMNSLFSPKVKDSTKSETPSLTTLKSPKFLESVEAPKVKLSWTEAKNALAYHVQLATDPNFKWLVMEEKAVQSTTIEFDKLEKGQKYYWRVFARKPDNEPSYTKSSPAQSAFITK